MQLYLLILFSFLSACNENSSQYTREDSELTLNTDEKNASQETSNIEEEKEAKEPDQLDPDIKDEKPKDPEPTEEVVEEEITEEKKEENDEESPPLVPPSASAYFLYIAEFDAMQLSIYKFTVQDKSLAKITSIPLIGSPSALVISGDKLYLSALPGNIYVFKIDSKSGQLEQLQKFTHNQRSLFLEIARDQKSLFSAEYYNHQVSVWKLNRNDGKIIEKLQTLSTPKFPHSVGIDPLQSNFYVPCKGSDKIYQYNWDNAAQIAAPLNAPSHVDVTTILTNAPIYPRHIRFHPNLNFAYVSNEHDKSVSRYQISASGHLINVDTYEAVAKNIAYIDDLASSDLRFSSTGKYLYMATRDTKHLGRDTISQFSVSQTGSLSLVESQSTISFPRAFSLTNDDNLLLVAGEYSNSVQIFAIDPASGKLSPLKTFEVGDRPYAIESIAESL
ncbi:MAG: beta-propeller fold lactonase family protein [Oligoflexales bacterium]|nr:beta-propeller fold lactonase family protein [Oligoflexales bacterium]